MDNLRPEFQPQSPLSLASTDQSKEPTPVITPSPRPALASIKSSPAPPSSGEKVFIPKTPKTPKATASSSKSVGATPIAKLKIAQTPKEPKVKDQSTPAEEKRPDPVVYNKMIPEIEGAIPVDIKRVPSLKVTEAIGNNLAEGAKQMAFIPGYWQLPVADRRETMFLPRSRTWATYVSAGLMDPNQWSEVRETVISAFRPPAAVGMSREERMERRNRRKSNE
ncbi:hypothetical protein IL306_008837 [Fusarium sp. DS 682]|nr:hypothetical protein IL306_008837 [Fusarium sp. DS 682]